MADRKDDEGFAEVIPFLTFKKEVEEIDLEVEETEEDGAGVCCASSAVSVTSSGNVISNLSFSFPSETNDT